jgi:hypothetical protein
LYCINVADGIYVLIYNFYFIIRVIFNLRLLSVMS